MNAVSDHLFRTTTLNRLYLKTLAWNVRAQKCFARCGYTQCGEMSRNGHHFLMMELTREQWQRRRGETDRDG